MSEFKGLMVEGQAIAELDNTEQFADIVEPEPFYRDLPKFSNPEESEEKLILNVRISGKDMAEYVPNKTSGKFIAQKLGTDMTQWLGKRIIWDVREEMVAGNKKQVLYVVDVGATPQ